MRDLLKATTGYMTLTSLLGIILGLVMLYYPGGTMLLMASAFLVFQLFLSVFILYYAFSEAAHYFKAGHVMGGIGYILLGILGTMGVWILQPRSIYFIVAFFLIFSGVGEIIGAFRPAGGGSLFLALLGIINIIIADLILNNPLILPLLIAWYVLFWGISRLIIALELRRALR